MPLVEVRLTSSGAVNYRNCLKFVDAGVYLDLMNFATWSVVRVAKGVSMVVVRSGRWKGGS